MRRGASIVVRLKPYRLVLSRRGDGTWAAVMRRIGCAEAPPVVVALSTVGRVCTGHPSAARIEWTRPGNKPRLWVGDASFAIPRRALTRVADWIDEQNKLVALERSSWQR